MIHRLSGAFIAFLAALAAVDTPAAAEPARLPLTIDDVLGIVALDRVAVSPDGEFVAAVVQRPVGPGEVFGRTAYETDPARADVWLISRRTGERRNLTEGAALAAGFWCAAWSPDGRRLAMLSTRPEGAEPRGGDNVRLYVWDRVTGLLRRLSDAPVMTQTRYGSPMYGLDVRDGSAGNTSPARCGDGDNAPFLWLDERRLFAVMLPDGAVSALVDEFSRPARHSEAIARALREGREPTVSVSDSGAEARSLEPPAATAILRTFDLARGATQTVAEVPAYPVRAELSLSVAPDRRRVAVLATLGSITPQEGWRFPYHDDTWWVEKRLGFADLAPGALLRWVEAPLEARYPLALLAWSPDSRHVALRARARPDERSTSLFAASADDLSVRAAAPPGTTVGGQVAGSDFPHDPPAHWLDADHLIARLQAGGVGRADWWLVGPGIEPANLTAGVPDPPEAIRRSAGGGFYAVSGGRLLALDTARRALVPVPGVRLPADSWIAWPIEPGRAASHLLLSGPAAAGRRTAYEVALGPGASRVRRYSLPAAAEIVEADPARGVVLTREAGAQGTFLRESGPGGRSRELLALNRHLGAVEWGARRLIDYRTADGEALQAAMILPPNYEPGRRYPTLVWVYGGFSVRSLDNYFLWHQMAGFYNLYLYAARGYVVLVPSMPLRRGEPYADIGRGVLPAVDRLVELGIADQDRIGVFGQSFGGFSVYALVTQTQRFRAAVAMAGIVDLPALYNQFDASARGLGASEHEKSENWSIAQMGQWGLDARPDEDPERYRRNSPIDHVDRVETPLLLIHGEYDKRGQMSQAEAFFYALYRRGRTARLLRYWGEGHSLAQSPANVRSVFEETVGWFNRHLAERPPSRSQP